MPGSAMAASTALWLALVATSILAAPRPDAETTAAPPGTEEHRTAAQKLNDKPIIGILSQELPRSLRPVYGNRTSYIAASYVKHIESAGARVVPIRINRPASYYEQLFRHLNGLLIPGGSAKLGKSGYSRAARALWDLAATHPQDYFPIWGTCLGFELLTFLELNGRHLTACKSQNQPLPLDFEPDGAESRMFASAGAELLRVFSEQNVTINFHKYCVSPETFLSTSLARDYQLIATNRDWNGLQFISAFEHKTRPIYGVQFHPEKNQFEWGTKKSINGIPHWPDAIRAAQYLANFFVNEARKSGHRFPSVEEELDQLIYNYPAEDVSRFSPSFVQVYLFD